MCCFTCCGMDMQHLYACHDSSAVCFCCRVANPEETDFFIKLLLTDLRRQRQQSYIE